MFVCKVTKMTTIKAKDFLNKHAVQTEDQVYDSLAEYMRKVHPEVPYRFDFGAGLKMGFARAKQQKRIQHGRAWPDLFIAVPKLEHDPYGGGYYHGLFIEIKRPGTVVFKKDGSLRNDEHLQEQYEVIKQLRESGYAACFAVGFDECVKIIENYFAGCTITD